MRRKEYFPVKTAAATYSQTTSVVFCSVVVVVVVFVSEKKPVGEKVNKSGYLRFSRVFLVGRHTNKRLSAIKKKGRLAFNPAENLSELLQSAMTSSACFHQVCASRFMTRICRPRTLCLT